MATESERCVDELISRNVKIDLLLRDLDENRRQHDAAVLAHIRDLLSETNAFIENNRSIIPPYCLKKITDSLRKLQNHADKPSTVSRFQFAPRPQVRPKSELQDKQPERESVQTDQVESVAPIYGFQSCNDQELKMSGDEVEAKDISLVDLDKCNITITGLASTVYISNVKHSKVVVFLACRSITVRNCENCAFQFVCQQLRIDATKKCKFNIFTSARSMLESSKELEFSEMLLDRVNVKVDPSKTELMKRAKFDLNSNNWKCVDDFDWLSPTKMSENYRLVDGTEIGLDISS